jgi:hypothetical protein
VSGRFVLPEPVNIPNGKWAHITYKVEWDEEAQDWVISDMTVEVAE